MLGLGALPLFLCEKIKLPMLPTLRHYKRYINSSRIGMYLQFTITSCDDSNEEIARKGVQ